MWCSAAEALIRRVVRDHAVAERDREAGCEEAAALDAQAGLALSALRVTIVFIEHEAAESARRARTACRSRSLRRGRSPTGPSRSPLLLVTRTLWSSSEPPLLMPAPPTVADPGGGRALRRVAADDAVPHDDRLRFGVEGEDGAARDGSAGARDAMLLPVIAVLLIVAGVSISTALAAKAKPPPRSDRAVAADDAVPQHERLTADAVAEADAERRGEGRRLRRRVVGGGDVPGDAAALRSSPIRRRRCGCRRCPRSCRRRSDTSSRDWRCCC